MRSLAPLTLCSLLLVCCAGPTSEPSAPATAPATAPTTQPTTAPTGQPPAHELTLPAAYASSLKVTAYAQVKDGLVSEQTELSYGLHDGYPQQITITADGLILGKECETDLGAVTWLSIAEVQGSAAQVTLVGGALVVDLVEEGTVSVLLDGEIAGQHCAFGGGLEVTTVPYQHRLELRVHRVAGFVVEQFHQKLSGCDGAMVLPSDALLWAPVAFPLDPAGQRFEPANAPTAATITLRSNGELKADSATAQLTAAPGQVAILVDTKLPVQGLTSFEVVGPGALTAVDATLVLDKAALKGSVSERIDDGGVYSLFLPEQNNSVNILLQSATTDRGKLCANVPGAWFAVESSTPAQCSPGKMALDPWSTNPVPLASIHALGECRLTVTIPGTSLSWTRAFTTTL